jgi:hypothetical protein
MTQASHSLSRARSTPLIEEEAREALRGLVGSILLHEMAGGRDDDYLCATVSFPSSCA